MELIFIRAHRAKGPEPYSPAFFKKKVIPIILRDRCTNIFFKEDAIDLLNALEYKINNSGSQNKIRSNKLIDFKKNN